MVIKINGLSESSLRKAEKKVKAYQNKVLANNREFVRELAQKGIEKASIYLDMVAEDYEPPQFSTQKPHVMNGSENGAVFATLRLRGEDVAFVEFGAGIHYNDHPHSSPHPLGVELGFTIGSYGQGQGIHDYWFYRENGTVEISEGTPAAMPLYHASVTMRQCARVMAMTRFRSK